MNITLTGGSGFLGKYLIDAFVHAGHSVNALSRSPDRQKARDRVRWIEADLTKLARNETPLTEKTRVLAESLTDCDALVHAAFDRPSARGFTASPEDPVAYFQSNVMGTLGLMETARQQGVGRFVLVSSGAVHDEVLPDHPLDENHPFRPKTLYGAAKSSLESIVHAYGLSGQWSACTIRPVMIYGLADPPSKSRWFDLVRSVAHGDPVNVTGGGKCVHAADIALGILTLLGSAANDVDGQTFNCCDDLISEIDVARIARELTGSNASISGSRKKNRHPMVTTKLSRLGHVHGGPTRLRETIQQLIDA